MAESSRSDENRSRRNEAFEGRTRRTTSEKSKPTNEERTDREDKVSGFNPTKSLKSYLGSRRKDAPADPDNTGRARPTGNILHDMRKGDSHRPTTTTTTAVPATTFCPPTKQTRNSMGKQMRASADDLISSSAASSYSSSSSSSSSANRWVPSSQRFVSSGTKTSSDSITSSKYITLATNYDEINSGSSSDLIDEFFVDRWSQCHSDTRTRAFSSGDAEEVGDAGLAYDIDSIRRTKALDVSAAKDRISIKPKGKKLTFALEERVRRATLNARPVGRVQLQSLAELNEEDEDGEVSSKNSRSRTRGQVELADVAPPRRKRTQAAGPPVPEKGSYRNSVGFIVTPAMLTGALRKQPTTDCQSSQRRIKPADADVSGPPLDGGERRRRRSEEQTIGINWESKQQNGGFVPRSPPPQAVLPGCSDEERVNNIRGARPKDPPKTRPKTRPKTVLHHSGSVSSPSEPVPSPPVPSRPEWLTRLKKRGAVVE